MYTFTIIQYFFPNPLLVFNKIRQLPSYLLICKKALDFLSKAPLEHSITFHTFQFFSTNQVIHPFHPSLTFQKTDV